MLYIMRHGLTDWNKEMRLQGQNDIPLNDDGIRMAKEASDLYKDVHFDIAFCSPMIRARQTAELLLAGRDVPIVYDDRLREMCFGICEGIKDYRNPNTSPVSKFFLAPASYNGIEGGESLDDLFKRTGEFLDDKVYPLLSQNKDVLIIGHGAMNSSIVCQIKNRSRKEFWDEGIENCRLLKLC